MTMMSSPSRERLHAVVLHSAPVSSPPVMVFRQAAVVEPPRRWQSPEAGEDRLGQSTRQFGEALATERLRNSRREQELQQQLAAEQAARLEAEQRLAARSARGAGETAPGLVAAPHVQQQLIGEMAKQSDLIGEMAKQSDLERQVLDAVPGPDQKVQQQLIREMAKQSDLIGEMAEQSDLERQVLDAVPGPDQKAQQQLLEEMARRLEAERRLHKMEKQLLEARQQLLQKDAQLQEFRQRALENERRCQEALRGHQAMQGEVLKQQREVCALQEQLSEELSLRQAMQRKVMEQEGLAHQTHGHLMEMQAPKGDRRPARSLSKELARRQAKEKEYVVQHISHQLSERH